MALYTPDYKLIESEKIIEALDNEVQKQAVEYVIQTKDDYIKDLMERIESYQAVFNAIDKFLPNHNPRF